MSLTAHEATSLDTALKSLRGIGVLLSLYLKRLPKDVVDGVQFATEPVGDMVDVQRTAAAARLVRSRRASSARVGERARRARQVHDLAARASRRAHTRARHVEPDGGLLKDAPAKLLAALNILMNEANLGNVDKTRFYALIAQS